MLPLLERRLRGSSTTNTALQDILKTCAEGDEVVAIEPYITRIHNTKLTVRLKTGEQRAHLYNRLDLANVLGTTPIPTGSIEVIVNALNLLGYDFTSDDLELVDGVLRAKATSLGYYGGITVEESITAILDHQGGLVPSFSLDWVGMMWPTEMEIPYRLYTFTLKIGSRPEPIVFTYTPDDAATLQQYNSNSNGFLAGWLSEKWNALDLYEEMSLMISSQNSPGFMVQNLLDKPNSFELVVTRQASLSSSGPVITQTPLRMGRYDMLPFGERIAPDSSLFEDAIFMPGYTEYYNEPDNAIERNGVRPNLFEVSVNGREYVEVEGDEFSADNMGDNSLDYIIDHAILAAGYPNMLQRENNVTLSNRSLDYISIKIRATFGNEVLVVFDAELGTLSSQVDAKMPTLF